MLMRAPNYRWNHQLLILTVSAVFLGSGQKEPPTTHGRATISAIERSDSILFASWALQQAGQVDEALLGYLESHRLICELPDPDAYRILNTCIVLCTTYDIDRDVPNATKYACRCDSLYDLYQSELSHRSRSDFARKLVFPFLGNDQLDKARWYATQSLISAENSEDEVLVLRAKERMCNVYSSTGEFGKAIPVLEELVEVRTKRVNSPELDRSVESAYLSYANDDLGICYSIMGEPEKAIYYFRRSLKLDPFIPRSMGNTAGSLINVGVCHVEIGLHWDSVMYYLEKARSVPRDRGLLSEYDLRSTVLPNEMIARAFLGQGTIARQLVHQVLGDQFFANKFSLDWATVDDPSAKLGTIDLAARTYQQLHVQSGAPLDLDTALALYKAYRSGTRWLMQSADPNSMFLQAAMMSKGVDAQLDMLADRSNGSCEEAELVASLFNERQSLDLRRSRQFRRENGIGTQRSYDAFRSLGNRRNQLLSAPLDGPEAIAELDSINQAIKAIQASLLVLPEEERELIKRVQAAIDGKTLVLAYAWTSTQLHLLAITKSGAKHASLGAVNDFQESVERMLVNVHSNASYEETEVSFALKKALIPDEFVPTGIDHLVILPDGPLRAVPFEALDVDEAKSSDRLMDRYDVRYEHSLSFMMKKAYAVPDELNVFAYAPVFANTTSTALVSRRGTPAPGSVMEWYRSGWGPLEYNVLEVQEIMALTGGKVLDNTSHPKQALMDGFAQFPIIHLATHAYSSDSIPELSGIVLMPGSGSDGASGRGSDTEVADQEVVLFAHEIESMTIRAAMVVLSACETATGKERKGEGLMSLTRSFRSAGAESVVSSLWKVDDQATKEIMVKFYEQLAEGLGKADALAAAKRWYRTEHPKAPASHWAAFILIGDNEPVKLVRDRNWWPWVLAIAGVALLTVTMVVRRRKGCAA